MADAIVNAHVLRFGSKGFFRAGSIDAVIGAVGVKRTPITRANYLEVKDRIKSGKLRIREIGPVEIDSQRTSKTDFLANISLAKVFRLGSADTGYEDVRDHKLSLVYFMVDFNDMVRAINDSPAIREDLKRWGDDARVVTSGFTVVQAETAKRFATSTEAQATITVQGVTIEPKIGVDTGGTTSVEFPVGSFFAYGLARLVWDEKKEKNAHRVVDLKTDQPGL